MKTDDLIKALAADVRSIDRPIGRTLFAALAVGTIGSIAAFLYNFGMRADVAQAMTNSWRFDFKLVFALAVAVPAAAIVLHAARPDGHPAKLMPWFTLAIVLILAAVLVEFATMPDHNIAGRIFTANWTKCMLLIPALSLAPLAAVLYALKRGAPSNPTLAGAVGGLLSGGIGAFLYATHCDSDSPLFVAVWYVLGITAITALGALLGSRMLRW